MFVVRLISAMCRDTGINDAKQSLEADMISQEVLKQGALVQLVALLNPSRVASKEESVDTNLLQFPGTDLH